MSVSIWIILVAVGIPAGVIAGYFFRKSWAVREAASAEAKAHKVIDEAKVKQKEILLEAKEKSLEVIEAAKKEEENHRRDLRELQERLEKRESRFDQQLLELENRQQAVTDKSAKLDALKQEVLGIRDQQIVKLEKIAALTKDEAQKALMDSVESRMKDELLIRIRKLQHEANEQLEQQARTMLSTVMQRIASAHAAETSTTIVNLPSDEMKGRIIGREGRNIKAVENLTGVEIIVDDTPEAIVISGFNPIRRHVAKRALDKLIIDGRIHPGRIEEAINQAKKELAKDIKKAGEEAAYEVGVVGLDPKLIQLLGRLRYRTSYGQNVLKHSVEVANLAGLLAEELGANVSIAKKGGLLHDIGKAVDHEIQGTHTQIGHDIMRKFGLPEEVAYIAIAHHEDEPKTLEGTIVKIADAISGARPGARKDTFENYVQRLEELEETAKSFPGVEKAYAIQAGREIRVFVSPDKMDDYGAVKLARSIADKIEQELKYPGEIKVNVIREKRIIEYAR